MNKALTVKQINNYISGVFDDELILHDISVTGEVFEFRTSQNNTFIVLKEDDSVLECYKFGRIEALEKGARVTIRGRIKFYHKGGRISLTIFDIKQSGEGTYHLQFLKLKEELRQKGCFDNKTPLPTFIKNIALITSTDGAVIHDFFSVLTSVHDYLQIQIHNVSVQGDCSSQDIARAIADINLKRDADVIVVARGGGSHRDLLPFNTKEIAAAVYGSKIPIISAVGHETDYTLCDFCSSRRAPTPSLAAEIIAKINQSWKDAVFALLARGQFVLEQKIRRLERHISHITKKLAHRNELAILNTEKTLAAQLTQIYSALAKKHMRMCAQLRSKAGSLSQHATSDFLVKQQEFAALSAKLDGLSPLKLMAGGYAKVISDGVIIKSVSSLQRGKTLKVALFDGTFTARVEDISKS